MAIYCLFVINRAGGLIFEYDALPKMADVEVTFSQCVDLKLALVDNRPTVTFGESNGVQVGHVVLECDGQLVGSAGRLESQGGDLSLFDYLSSQANYPVTLKFGRPALSTNEKIILSSMFHSFHAISAQLSPIDSSGGITAFESCSYRLQCLQSTTGCKFVSVGDLHSAPMDQLLSRLYELYADYALKNPFYSLDMPIRPLNASMYSGTNSAVFSYLSKIPNLTGYMVLSEDGAILASSGDLMYDQRTAEIVHQMVHVSMNKIVEDAMPNRLIVVYHNSFYSIVSSAKKVFVAKISTGQGVTHDTP